MVKKQQLKQTIERDYSNIAALMIQRDHEIVFEQSFNNFTTATPLHVFSVTKSIISLLYGIARDNVFKPLGINIEKSITFATKEEQLAWYKATDVNGWVA